MFFLVPARASDKTRAVEFEWDAIKDSFSYEIEFESLTPPQKGKRQNFKTKSSIWTGRLIPSIYSIKLRSLDQRGVPGGWSKPVKLNVSLFGPELQEPQNQSRVFSDGKSDNHLLAFKWSAVDGAKSYLIQIESQDKSFEFDTKSFEPTISVELPVSKIFTWKVTPIDVQNKNGDSSESLTFNLIGHPLSSPKIATPFSGFVRDLDWDPVPNALAYDWEIFNFDRLTKKWVPKQKSTDQTATKVAIPLDWKGGNYKLIVTAKAPLYLNSPPGEIEVPINEGDRSALAEMKAMLRASLEKPEGWYGIASYLITMMDYRSQTRETSAQTKFNAIAGTGRVGAGFYSPLFPWGFVGIIDSSGIRLNEQNNIYFSGELNAIHHYKHNKFELRTQIGGLIKELPALIGILPLSFNKKMTSTLTAHLGTEFWYAFNQHLGFQLNAHLYYNILGVTIPDKAHLVPSLSSQFGVLGSYRITKKITGLVGYARRSDTVKYKSPLGGASVASEGDINSVEAYGDYLNLVAEMSF